MMESELILLCKNNLSRQVVELFLEKLPEPIDVLYKNGLAIRLAIKNNNFIILAILIDYYFKEVLQKYDFGTTNYNISKHKLKEVLEDALQSFDTSKEVLTFLKTRELLPEDINDNINPLFDGSSQILKWVQENQKDPHEGIKANVYYILSTYHKYGWAGVIRNPELADNYLEKAATLGHTQACYDIAKIFLLDHGNTEKALFYINKGLTKINSYEFDCKVTNHHQAFLKQDLEGLIMICEYAQKYAKMSERSCRPKFIVA